MSHWYTTLRDQLAAANHRPRELSLHSGATLLLTDHGARAMAVRCDALSENAFWTPEKFTADPAGGDRLWIAPEVAYFWPSLDKAREDPVRWAATPPDIDPARYAVVHADQRRVMFETDMTLTDARVGKAIHLRVRRGFHAVNPPSGLPPDIACAGYAASHSLEILGGDEGALAGAWALLQLPPTGTLICPTTRPLQITGDVTSYYDPFGDRHVQTDGRRLRFLIDAGRRIKMGLRAEWTTGRMGYYRPTADGRAVLILRIFNPQPGEPYVDVPRAADIATRTGGDCLQAYNDDGTFGGFGEMEHHDPALIVGIGPTQRSGGFVTHVLTGPDLSVRAAAEALLGVEVSPIAAG
jgi:hypothetical protein